MTFSLLMVASVSSSVMLWGTALLLLLSWVSFATPFAPMRSKMLHQPES